MSQYPFKQVLLIRRDLGMRRGKEIAQGAHASLKVVLENREHPDVISWLQADFAKIAVVVESEEELRELCREANEIGVINSVIVDNGATEFSGVKTVTCAAIGPGPSDKVDLVTGHLRLR